MEKLNLSYVSVDFSSCFNNVEGDFLLNKINFVGGDKLSPVFKHGFLRSEENLSCLGLVKSSNFALQIPYTLMEVTLQGVKS